jgi:hypothetical protein
MKSQVAEADGILVGLYLRSRSVRLEDGKVATQMIFKMEKEHGLQSEVFKMDEVIVHYPGGKLPDEIVEVQGVPKFVPGERIVLFAKSVHNRFWGMNLGMGSFKVVNYGDEVMLVNSIFPADPLIGQVKLREFEELVSGIKGSSLKVVKSPESVVPGSPRAPAALREGKNRTLASGNEGPENESASSHMSTFWLLLALGLCGAAYRLTRQRGR